jgi:hypothetical protein
VPDLSLPLPLITGFGSVGDLRVYLDESIPDGWIEIDGTKVLLSTIAAEAEKAWATGAENS